MGRIYAIRSSIQSSWYACAWTGVPRLVQRDEAAPVGLAVMRLSYVRILAQATLTVAGRDVADSELAEVVTRHLGLDLHCRKDLKVRGMQRTLPL